MRKTIISSLLLLSLGSVTTASANGDVAKAMKAYQYKEYNRAGNMLTEAMPSLSGQQADQARLSLGIVTLKNAELNQQLFKASLAANMEYLEVLVTRKGKTRSRLAKLYYGETLLNAGEHKSAIKQLTSFLKTKGISQDARDLARINLGLAQYLSGQKTNGKNTWNKVKSANPEITTGLLVAKLKAGLKPKFDIKKLHQNIVKLESGKGAGSRHLSNMIYLLNKSDMADAGYALLSSENIDSPSDRESFKGGKQISFYDTSMHSHMANLLLSVSKKQLGSFASNSKYAPTAAFYLMDAGVIFKDESQIATAAVNLKSAGGLPGKLKPFEPVKTSASDYIKGQKKQAQQAWEAIISQNSSNMKMLEEVLRICASMAADCQSTLDKSKQFSAKGQGRKFIGINSAIGLYLMSQNKAAEALSFLELARDKSNKNKISANDPILLVSLAEAYRKEKNYSENLEIFFEMNRHFPAVRQIQEAVQGTYAMHQKSAGDVKIF